MDFNLNATSRKKIVCQLLPELEDFYKHTKERAVSANWDVQSVKKYVDTFDFQKANDIDQVLAHVIGGLNEFAVHTPHPNYFGLFNPRPNFPSILADLITATFNPQLAAWSHSPFANEVENRVIREFGKKMGYPAQSIDGTFCTGGAESNTTALLCALNRAFPEFNSSGIRGVARQPLIYCSTESHHSILKAAKSTGLGANAVIKVPVDSNLKMDVDALRRQIRKDRRNQLFPLMIVGTAGTTGAGAIDDLNAIHTIARQEGLWLHIDAAYGGAAVISKKYKDCLSGIDLSDSITLDLHKWFSIPMGASLFLTRDKQILHQAFSVRTNYMPEDGDPSQIVDPYIHSLQWSRRFIGLKIYLPLVMFGWEGYEKVIDHQVDTGRKLEAMLKENGWRIKNNSPLPIICFSRQDLDDGEMTALVNQINASGKAWLSAYPIDGQTTARVCITNYSTGENELSELLRLLEEYRVGINVYLNK